MLRWLALLLISIGVCTAFDGPALAALPEGIQMEVEAGYGGFIHPGRVNPVMVTLDNQSADLNLSGQLVLEYNGVEYSTPLELPTPSRKRFFLYFPCDSYSPILQLRIRSRQYSETFTLGDPTNFKTMQPRDMSVLVLTRQRGSLNMLNQQAIGRLYRDLYRSESSELGPGRTHIAYMNLEDVDPTPKFFTRADMLVLADIDYQQVTPELAAAVSAAAASGTSVVFSLGLAGAGVSGSPLGALCPLQPSGTVQVYDLGAFGRRFKIQPGVAPATLATGRVAEGARVLDSAGTHPVVVQAGAGSGTITALAFDFTQAPFKLNPNLAAVFLENVLPIEDTVAVTNLYAHPGPISRELTGLAEAQPMLPGFVMLFLLAYILLVGPLNFLILDRFKRRTLVWTTIPLIIVAFSAMGLYTGYLYRGGNNVLAYFHEVHVYPGATYAPYQTVMMAFTAERSTYELTVEDESAFLYPSVPDTPQESQSYYGRRPQQITLFSTGRIDPTGQPELTMTQGKWTSKHFMFQGHRQLGNAVTAQLSAVPSEAGLRDVRGSFTLNLPFDLAECQLLGQQHALELGDLRGQGSYDIATHARQSLGLLPAESENYVADRRGSFRRAAIRSSEAVLRYSDELLLVGFTDKLDEITEFNRPHLRHSLAMIVVHLPYTPRFDAPIPVEVRTLLTGGAGFEIYRSGSFYREDLDIALRQYILQQGSVLQLRSTVSGRLDREQDLLLHVKGFVPKDEASVDDLSRYIRIEELRNNEWRPVSLVPRDLQADIPLAGRRQLDYRIVALQEVVLSVPRAEVY